LGLVLNPLFPTLPLGTLAANLIGGFFIGLVLALADPLGFLPAARLLLTTGVFGGLTTFSTFSAEVTTLVFRLPYRLGLVAVALHLLGSLLLTVVGLLVARALLVR